MKKFKRTLRITLKLSVLPITGLTIAVLIITASIEAAVDWLADQPVTNNLSASIILDTVRWHII